MTRRRLRVSRLDGRRYSYPYPVYYRPPLRWITPSFTTKKVTRVARDFGPEILRAIRHNDLEFLQRILENRLRANSLITKLCMMDVGRGAASRRVSCPLIVASQKKDPTILRYMLEKGADPNYVEYTSHRPHSYCALHTASKLGLLETTETLLLFKANPNAVDSRGETALLIAVHASNCALAKLLLSHGANPNASDKHGCTPLHIATCHGHLEMVNLLLSYGADLKLPNRNGVFPVHLAASAGHAHLIEALLGTDTASANAPCVLDGIRQMPLHLAAGNGHVEVVTALLDFRADVNAKDSTCNTALHHVVLKPYQANTMRNMNHFIATAQALLKAGISFNDENDHGETAMVLAASNQFPKVAKLILTSAGGKLRIEPEMLRQILLEQNILTGMDQNEALIGKQTDTSPKHTLPSDGNAKSFPAANSGTRNRLQHEEQQESKPASEEIEESHPLKEIQSNVVGSHHTNSSAQSPDVFAKRFPLPKSDLRNYQQFRHSPTIENEISTFTVTANKGAERMCILFDKNSPSGKKASSSAKKGSENEFRPYVQKKSISRSSDLTKPAMKTLKSTDDNTAEQIEPKQERTSSSSEQKQRIQGKNDQEQDSSRISDFGAEADDSVKENSQRRAIDDSDEGEESCWIDYKVEKDDLLAPDDFRDTQRYSAPSLRHYSKSPSGFFSEGGGLRGLRLRVTGEVPKAYTCKQKAAKRRAFFLAAPVGIESMGDYDQTHLSMSSLPEMGGLAWEKAMQRRTEWTESPKPIYTKRKTPHSKGFSPIAFAGRRNPDGSRQPKSDYRITGLFPQPYKSFGKIETKTDAIEAALMEYESDEEYESADDDVEPLTKQWVSEMAEHQWHRSPQDSDDQFDTSIDDVVHANVLDESISSVEAEQIAGIISNGYLVSITEEEKNLGQTFTDSDAEETDEEAEEEDEEEDEREEQKEERRETGEAEQRNETKAVQSQTTSGKSGVGVLRVLHGYPSKGAPSSNGSTMVVSSLEPEIQRLTIDNIVLGDSSTSDDGQDDDEISDQTKGSLPMQMENSDLAELGKGEHQKENYGGVQVEHHDKEVMEILRSSKAPSKVSTQDVDSKQNLSQKTEEKENKKNLETGRERRDKKEDPKFKQSKMSDGADDEGTAETHNAEGEEELIGENLEEPKKKGKKGKKSSKKHKTAAKDSEDYENTVGEEIPAQTVAGESPVKGTKKQFTDKEEEIELYAYSEEPERRGKQRKEQIKAKESPERRDESQERIANNLDSEQSKAEADRTINVRTKLQSEKGDLNENDEDNSHQVYNAEPGSRRKPSKRVKANDAISDLTEGQENESERLPVDEFTSDTVINRNKDAKQKQKKLKDSSSRKGIAEDTQNEDSAKSKELKTSFRRKKVASQNEEIGPAESELSETNRAEIAAMDDSENTGKPAKKKTKKKVKGNPDSVTGEPNAGEPTNDHSALMENLSKGQIDLSSATNEVGDQDSMSAVINKQDGTTSFETASESVVEESSFVGSGKKPKKSKKITGKDVGVNNNWGINSAVHSEVWQEAMNEEPLASSETVYDAMHLTDAEKAKAKKTAKKKSSAGKKQRNIEAGTVPVEDLGDENLMVKGKRNSAEYDDNLVQTSHQQQISFPVRPVKETDIDDEFLDEQYDPNTSESQRVGDEKRADRQERMTMETSVDDIMDDLVESRDDTTSNDVKPIDVEFVRKRQKSRETSIDDDLDDFLPCSEPPAAGDTDSEADLKVERSLETNVDEYNEEPFARRSSQKSNKASTDMETSSHQPNVRETVESKASKVTNVDEYQAVPTPFGVEIKLKQPDSRFQQMADTEGGPVDSEQLEAVESQKSKGIKKAKKKKTKSVPQEEEKYSGQSEVQELENAEGNRVVDPEVGADTKTVKKKKQRKVAEEEFNEATYPETGDAEDVQNLKQKKKAKKQISDKAVRAEAEENLEEASEQAKMQKKKAPESVYEDNDMDEEVNNFDEETEIDMDNDDVRIYPPKREHIIDAFIREARIDEDEENQDDEETTEVKESDHEETNIADDLDEDSDLDDKHQQKIQAKQLIKIKRFGEDSSLSEDNDEIQPEKNALRTFNIRTDSPRKVHETTVTGKEKPEKEMDSDEDFGEIKRCKKTRKQVEEAAYVETGIDEDLENINREVNDKKVKSKKVTEADKNMDRVRKDPQKLEHVRVKAVTETGIDEDIESEDDEEMAEVQESSQKQTGTDEDLEDEGRHKTRREKIQINRFGEDSSLSEESEEIIPQNSLKTFNIGTDSPRKVHGKPVTKKDKPEKEMGSDEDLGEIKRRKKTRIQVKEAAYVETGIDEDLDNINQEENDKKVKAKKVSKVDKNMDHERIYPQKMDHVRGKAVTETGIDDDIYSQDEDDMEENTESGQRQTGKDEERQKIQRDKIKIKRFGEDSSQSEESDSMIPQSPLKTFNIGTEGQRLVHGKSTTKKETPEKEMGSDEDSGEIKRHKKTRKQVVEAAYVETGIDEDLDNINREENGQKVKSKKVFKVDKNIDHERIYPQKLEHVRAIKETGLDDDIETEDDEEMAEMLESGQKQTGTDDDLEDEGRHKTRREKIQINRFGEDSSLSEESEEIIPQNSLKTFNIGTDSPRKVHGKPVTKKDKPEKEIGSDEDFGEIKRRKKTRIQVKEAAYVETGIDEDLDNINQEENDKKVKAKKVTKADKNMDHERIYPQKMNHVRGKAVTETGIDDDIYSQDEDDMEENTESGQRQTGKDEERQKIQRDKIKIKRFGEDSSQSEESDSMIPQSPLKTFNIGTEGQRLVHGKSTTKKETPEKEMGSDEDLGEIKRRKKTRKQVEEAAYVETGIDEDLENIKGRKKGEMAKDSGHTDTSTDEDLDDDNTNEKQTKQTINIQRFEENSSFSEDDDTGIDAKNTAKTFLIGTDNKMKTERVNKVSKPMHDAGINNDEDYGELRRREKTRKHAVKPAYVETGIDDDLENEEEDGEETKAGTELSASGRKKTQDQIATKQTDLNNKKRNALQFNKPVSGITSEEEEWTEEESEEEEVEEHIAKTKRGSKEVVPKLDAESRKHSKQQGEIEVSDNETSNNEMESGDDFECRRRTKAARGSTGKSADKLGSAAVKQNDKILSETNFDQLSESEDSDEHQTRVKGKVDALLSKKKQFDEQEFDQNEENEDHSTNIADFMGNDESEEIGGSFSRKQAGRVSRGRAKKGSRKIQDPTLEPSSNADTEGSSRGDPNEDGRRRPAGSQKLRNWNTEETEITETEVTSQARVSKQSDNNARNSTPSGVMANDKTKEDTKRRSLQSTNKPSPGLDMDESIRRKRRMEMTEDITTTVKTSPILDNSLSPSGTANSSYSLPSPPTRQPPKKRDIQPMNTSAPLLQETTIDTEPSPPSKPALDSSLLEVTPSKTDPNNGNSMDASLLRKSMMMERTFQQRAQRQHSSESLNRHRPRPQTNEFEEKKSNSDANLTRRKRSSLRSRSTGHLDIRGHSTGMYKTQRDQKMRPVNFKQTDKTLQEAALETITTSALNEPRWLRKMDDLENIVYTRGVYRPQPVYWRGSNRGANNTNDESRMSALQVQVNNGLNESTEDAGNRTAESLDKSKQNGNADLNNSSPAKLSLSKDGDESENRNSAFAAYNKRVTIHEEERQPQLYGRRHRHRQRSRTARHSSREESYKAPQITEPNAVDFSKYGIVAELWMEQVDMKTVLKSRTMYLTILPAGAQPPDEIMRSIRHVPTVEDQAGPAQWIIARGRTIRRQKHLLDGHHQRMSESFFFSGGDSDPDLSRSANPMSPGKQSLLFFKVGGRWPDLAWALFEGIHTDAATLRMIKDIQLKNPGRLTDQIQDMMNRWWTQKGQAATIEELRRSLELINLPFVQDETLNVTMANSFFSTSDLDNKLAFEQVEAADPDVSRMVHEYNQQSHNASFNADHRQSPQTAQPFSSDALLRQMQQKGLMSKSSPSLRNSQLKSGDNRDSSTGRSDSRDASFIRHQSRNESTRPFSSQDSLNTENIGEDNKRKSFAIVQPKTPKDKKFRHESNM